MVEGRGTGDFDEGRSQRQDARWQKCRTSNQEPETTDQEPQTKNPSQHLLLVAHVTRVDNRDATHLGQRSRSRLRGGSGRVAVCGVTSYDERGTTS
jgi:hypothetical protein